MDTTFNYKPTPPEISTEDHNYRSFSGSTNKKWIYPSGEQSGSARELIYVIRWGHENHALLSLSSRNSNGMWSASLSLSADDLKDLAQKLLDAAHDLEANPAPMRGAR